MTTSRIAPLVAVALSSLTQPAAAGLTFYYDPITGNVAFDTAGTRTGETYSYSLELNHSATDIRFRKEEHVLVWPSALTLPFLDTVSENSLSNPVSGYFTIGEVLPPAIDESTWVSLFEGFAYFTGADDPGRHSYADCVGCGHAGTLPAEFVFGQPDRPFDNRWDLVDPDTLDWAEAATLVYDPATGDLTVDTTVANGGHIAYFTLGSDGAFLAENYSPWLDVPLTNATPDTIFLAADAIEPGIYSLGEVLPTGLSLGELQATLTDARFIGRVGFGSSFNFDLETDGVGFQIAMAIPEPTTILLLALGVCGFAIRR